MMRRILLLLLSLFLASTTHAAYDKQAIAHAISHVVHVHSYHKDGGVEYGSGVVVGKNQVLTNCHVLRDVNDRPWVSYGEDTFIASSVQADSWHDLCLLTTEALPVEPVEIGDTAQLHDGDDVFAIGHSSGVMAPLTSYGGITALYEFDGSRIIKSTARFELGASGSGLFDGQGRLVGINTFKTLGLQAYYYSVPVTWLAALKQKPIQTKFPVTGSTFWEAAEEARPFFLKIAPLEIKKDWASLSKLCHQWVAAEPNNPEAWFELGTVQENLHQQDDAKTAYHKVLTLDSHSIGAKYRLGVIASKEGDLAQRDAVHAELEGIDKELAAQFSSEAGCTAQC